MKFRGKAKVDPCEEQDPKQEKPKVLKPEINDEHYQAKRYVGTPGLYDERSSVTVIGFREFKTGQRSYRVVVDPIRYLTREVVLSAEDVAWINDQIDIVTGCGS